METHLQFDIGDCLWFDIIVAFLFVLVLHGFCVCSRLAWDRHGVSAFCVGDYLAAGERKKNSLGEKCKISKKQTNQQNTHVHVHVQAVSHSPSKRVSCGSFPQMLLVFQTRLFSVIVVIFV